MIVTMSVTVQGSNFSQICGSFSLYIYVCNLTGEKLTKGFCCIYLNILLLHINVRRYLLLDGIVIATSYTLCCDKWGAKAIPQNQ